MRGLGVSVTLTPFRPGYLALDARGAAGHHDAGLMDQAGRVLARARLSEDAARLARLHALIGEHAGAGEADVSCPAEGCKGRSC